jgi:membrane-bound serine protease (ClpP class)
MNPTNAIIVLTLVGFLLLASEVFVPGMILGLLGVLCLVGAVAFGYAGFGPMAGTLILAGVFTVSLVGFFAWMFAFPHTAIGRRILLKNNLTSGEGLESRPTLVGQEGVAHTPLRPAGTALINGKKIDVVAESSLIDVGEAVTVILQEGMRVVVRRKGAA